MLKANHRFFDCWLTPIKPIKYKIIQLTFKSFLQTFKTFSFQIANKIALIALIGLNPKKSLYIFSIVLSIFYAYLLMYQNPNGSYNFFHQEVS
jgi:hypothetical protein